MSIPKVTSPDQINGYAIELHAHIKGSSGCAMIDSGDMLRMYKDHGYSCVVITNHFGPWGAATTGLDDKEHIDLLKDLYDTARSEGEKIGINVLYGVEISFTAHWGDFLLYGFDWDFLYNNIGIYKRLTVEEFYPIAKKNGFLLYHAHPFRGNDTPRTAELDGFEVYNGHPGYDCRAQLAYDMAKENNLLMISGSDFHFNGGECRGGIVTKHPIICMNDLMTVLRNSDYELICDSEFARTYKK